MSERINEIADTERGSSLAGKYLTFDLSSEVYCIDILMVYQIIQLEEITNVPLTPDYIRGVLNLRGKVTPVLDLRVRFDMEISADSEKTSIVIVEIPTGKSFFRAGIIIDAIREVVMIDDNHLEEVPPFGSTLDVTFLKAIAKIDDTELIRLILDVEKIFEATLNDSPELVS